MSKELNQARKAGHMLAGTSAYHLDIFGDYLAEKEGYKCHTGMEAVFYFLMQRHNWTPSQVRSMNHEDLDFALAEDMQGWTLPVEAKI